MGKRTRSDPEGATLSELLKRLIRDSGLSTNQVAQEAGVSQPQLSRFLRGERTLTLPAAERLLAFFGVRFVEPKAKK